MPRAVTRDDLDWMHALNRAHETELSPLDRDGFADVVSRAAHVRAVDDAAAFLVAFDETSSYDSVNFRWFRERLDSFVYVDRIVVAPHERGRGLARLLYEDLFAHALEHGRQTVACEVNFEPPNPASDAFHLALGFEPLDIVEMPGRNKSVRYMRKTLTPSGT